jgi:hypothetical protein
MAARDNYEDFIQHLETCDLNRLDEEFSDPHYTCMAEGVLARRTIHHPMAPKIWNRMWHRQHHLDAAFVEAVCLGDIRFIQYWLRVLRVYAGHGTFDCALIIAANSGHVDIVKIVLQTSISIYACKHSLKLILDDLIHGDYGGSDEYRREFFANLDQAKYFPFREFPNRMRLRPRIIECFLLILNSGHLSNKDLRIAAHRFIEIDDGATLTQLVKNSPREYHFDYFDAATKQGKLTCIDAMLSHGSIEIKNVISTMNTLISLPSKSITSFVHLHGYMQHRVPSYDEDSRWFIMGAEKNHHIVSYFLDNRDFNSDIIRQAIAISRQAGNRESLRILLNHPLA